MTGWMLHVDFQSNKRKTKGLYNNSQAVFLNQNIDGNNTIRKKRGFLNELKGSLGN